MKSLILIALLLGVSWSILTTITGFFDPPVLGIALPSWVVVYFLQQQYIKYIWEDDYFYLLLKVTQKKSKESLQRTKKKLKNELEK